MKRQRSSKMKAELMIKKYFDEGGDHTPPPKKRIRTPERPVKKAKNKRTFHYDRDIETLQDLIDMCEDYNSSEDVQEIPELDKLCTILDEMHVLNDMVGLRKVKRTIAEQLIFIAQDFQEEDMMMHMCIRGNPGMGKTCLAENIASIFAGIGILSNGDVITAKRSDLIGSHLGETAMKTTEVLTACYGNVLLIDEVYSLGSRDQRDSFSKECIDTINEFLSSFKDNMICIIAGYKEDIDDCFFACNKGLRRRFPWVYDIDDYTMSELVDIFVYQVNEIDWEIEDSAVEYLRTNVLVDRNKCYFTNFGGDTENMLGRCKISHAKRLFKSKRKNKCVLTIEDIEQGFEQFKMFKKDIKRESSSMSLMYI